MKGILLRFEKDVKHATDVVGLGLYSAYFSDEFNLYQGDLHIPPDEDKKLIKNKKKTGIVETFGNFYFGFSDYRQIRRWMYDDGIFDSLQAEGFYLGIYYGDIVKGNTQAMIQNNSNLKLIKKVPAHAVARKVKKIPYFGAIDPRNSN